MFTPGEVYPGSGTNAPNVSFDNEAVTTHGLEGLPEVAKERMLVIDLADLLCGPAGHRSGLRRIDDRWVGKCPLPDCASKLSSFVVWPDTDAWRCFNCMRGGGATALARLAGHALVAKARGR
jgi:hypothetical protein